jgi:hypothetical protein
MSKPPDIVRSDGGTSEEKDKQRFHTMAHCERRKLYSANQILVEEFSDRKPYVAAESIFGAISPGTEKVSVY